MKMFPPTANPRVFAGLVQLKITCTALTGVSPESLWLLLCPLPSPQTHNRHPQHHEAEPLWSLGHHTRDFGLFWQTGGKQNLTRLWAMVCAGWGARAGEWPRVLVLTLQYLKLSPFSTGTLSPISMENLCDPACKTEGKWQLWVSVARMMQGAE